MPFDLGTRVKVSTKLSECFLHACGLYHRRDKLGTIVEMLTPNSPVKAYKDSPIYRVLFDGEDMALSINAKLLEAI